MQEIESRNNYIVIAGFTTLCLACYYYDRLPYLYQSARQRQVLWRSWQRRFENHKFISPEKNKCNDDDDILKQDEDMNIEYLLDKKLTDHTSKTKTLRNYNGHVTARKSNWMWSETMIVDECLPGMDSMLTSHKKVILVMVGLPARGKSFVVAKLKRFVQWLGMVTTIWNVGNHRREIGKAGLSSEFFCASNEEAKVAREKIAMEVLENLLNWLEKDGHVAIFDATNTTVERRNRILQTVRARDSKIRVLFVETICDNEVLLQENYKLKCKNEDYAGMPPEVALADFTKRVKEYEKVYQPLDDTEDNKKISYIKVYNAGEKIQARFCQEFLESQLLSLLQNIHLFPRRIWLVRPGATITSERGILGLDSNLSCDGHNYAKSLASFMEKMLANISSITKPTEPVQEHVESFYHKSGNLFLHSEAKSIFADLEVWSSAARRSRQTAEYFRECRGVVTTTLLHELGGGDFEGLMYNELKELFPRHYKQRKADKLRYRYPGVGGESYVDVISRLKSLVIELERKKHDVLVICDKAVLRCLLGYFMDREAEEIPYLDAYENQVIELRPHRYRCDIHVHNFY